MHQPLQQILLVKKQNTKISQNTLKATCLLYMFRQLVLMWGTGNWPKSQDPRVVMGAAAAA